MLASGDGGGAGAIGSRGRGRHRRVPASCAPAGPDPAACAARIRGHIPTFNESVDDAHGMIRIFEVEFRPSEVLFQMEPQSYRVYLAEFGQQADGDDAEAGAAAAGAAEVATMTERGVTESVVEQAALAWLESTGWSVRQRRRDRARRTCCRARRLRSSRSRCERLRDALARLNPTFAAEAVRGCVPQAHTARRRGADPRNRALHRPGRGRRDGGVPRRRGRHPRRAGAGDRLRTNPTTITGWR